MMKVLNRGVLLVAVMLLLGTPVFATSFNFLDPNETEIQNDGYDLKKITIDDNAGATSCLTIGYQVYGTTLLNHDTNQQVSIAMWLNVGGFDQDPGENPTQYGMPWDFLIVWYGEKDSTIDGVYDDELVIFGQDLSALWNSGAETYDPGASDSLSLCVPWAQLVDTSANEAVPGHTLLPPSFQFAVKYENNAPTTDANADDEYPGDGEYSNVPEPLTMLGLFMGLGGVGAYIRKRRMS
jgi:hypothetical protein